MLILRPRAGRTLTGYVLRSIALPWKYYSHPSLINGVPWTLGFFTRAAANDHLDQLRLEEYYEAVAMQLDTISTPHRFLLGDGTTKVKIMPGTYPRSCLATPPSRKGEELGARRIAPLGLEDR